MAPRVKARVAASAPDDSEEDDLQNASMVPASKRAMPTTTRAKTARRASTGKPKAATKRKAVTRAPPREVLKDRTNEQHASDTEEIDEFDNDNMGKPKAKRAKMAAAAKTAKKPAAAKAATAKKGRAAKRAPPPEQLATIPETQQDPDQMEDVEQSIEVSLDPTNMDIAQEPTPKPAHKIHQRAPSVPIQLLHPRPSARPGSAQPMHAPTRERSGSAVAGARRAGDTALNEMTKKYENLQLKYESLEVTGKGDAESNFEKLKRASDQKARDSNDLVSSLKRELAELRRSSSVNTSETSGLQKQVSALTATNEKFTAERDELKDKLKVSQNEVKSMEAKLIAARQQLSSSVLEAKAHASAATKLTSSSTAGMGDAQKEAKMKENLYADLTGLIVCGVKRMDGEDVYDCIQTGRNGTLHFHLSIANDTTTPHPKTPSGIDYAEAEFAYEPLLDESRDRELLDLLPDYLTEEICFPRNHAQRFYSKVVDSMTKKIIIEDE